MGREKGNSIVSKKDTNPMKFNDLANMERQSDADININANVNPNVKFNLKDPIDNLDANLMKKELTTVMKGIYFDSEVWDVVEEQSKKYGRGGKSKIVNDIVKFYFEDKGLL